MLFGALLQLKTHTFIHSAGRLKRKLGFLRERFRERLICREAAPKGATGTGHSHVELFYWRPKTGPLNFGDHLSHVIVNKLLALHGHLLEEETPQPARMFAIGSVLHFANTGDVVWGSGVNGKILEEEHRFTSLDVRAVRGPLTQAFLQERRITVPPVFGDPALLLPTLFPNRFIRKNRRPYVVVPNFHDLPLVAGESSVISPLLAWNRCVEEILQARFVISSSLHGLIIAEAYGIPARLLRISETENLFKYQDYLQGTGRTDLTYATSIAEALEMGGMDPLRWDPQALLDAFPLELWKRPLLPGAS